MDPHPSLRGLRTKQKLTKLKLKAMCSRANTGGNAWLVATLVDLTHGRLEVLNVQVVIIASYVRRIVLTVMYHDVCTVLFMF
jgi:hypothetical protein